MSQPGPELVKGTIKADPNPLPAIDHLRLILQWETNAKKSELCVSEDGGEEKSISHAPKNLVEIEWIQGGHDYVFRLYREEESRQLLDELAVFKHTAGKIAVAPNPVPLEAAGKATIRWEVTAPGVAQVRISENLVDEKVVCQGESGSYEVSGLRSGIDYRFRLYTHPRGDLLNEVLVRVSDTPSPALLDRLKKAFEGKDGPEELAAFIAFVLPGCLNHPSFSKWFHLWEERGAHVTPVHFYEPIPDSRTLTDKIWREPQTLPGIDMNGAMQHRLLCTTFPAFKEEYDTIPIDPPPEGNAFYLRNGRFEGLDPLLAYCLVRHFQPRRIIEVGSGYSTLLLAQAARMNGNTQLHSIEPYPEKFLTNGVPGLSSLLAQKVEETDSATFDTLQANDILFIDTSHVVRIGGDVNFLFLKVLPRLNPGVIVHVHDIFLPLEYPQEWVRERRRFWTEQYLLQAFLTFNSQFEVLVSCGYLTEHFPEELKTVFPTADPWQGGSFWMRRFLPESEPSVAPTA